MSAPVNTEIPVLGFGLLADVQIDLPELLERRLLIQAGSGAGKSTLMRSFAEELSGQVQQFVIDPEGDLVTLRNAGDFVIVGEGGDVAADINTAKEMARGLMELGASAIFDLSGLNVHGQREYVRRLFDELSYLPRRLWHQLIVWLDEGHKFAPQGASSVSSQSVANAASTWRKRGYCLVVATQRLSKLDKDVAAELHNKLIGLTDDVDVKRAGEQLGMRPDQARELQELTPGTFYAKGPALSRDRVLVRARFPTTTPPPKGEIRTSAPPAPEKVRAILGKLGALALQSREELETEEGLRAALAARDAKVRQLESVQSFETITVTETITKTVIDQAAIDSAVERERERMLLATVESRRRLDATLTQVLQLVNIALADSAEIVDALSAEVLDAPVPSSDDEAAWIASLNVVSDESEQALTAPQQRIIDTAVRFDTLGYSSVSRECVAIWAEMSPTSSTVDRLFAALLRMGLLESPDKGRVSITTSGTAYASADVFTTPEALVITGMESVSDYHNRWRRVLSPSESALLDQAIVVFDGGRSSDDNGTEVSRTRLATLAELSPRSSTTDRAFAHLIGLELLATAGPGLVEPGRMLLPEIFAWEEVG